uniref:Insulin gene enhancer protein ISL-1 n=1 Tax=Strigamia maritima TaxID=126957 RepID=T1JEV2_STRMM
MNEALANCSMLLRVLMREPGTEKHASAARVRCPAHSKPLTKTRQNFALQGRRHGRRGAAPHENVSSLAEKRRLAMCVGCGSHIHDQYILRVAPDLEWHAACLKCADCHQFLDESCTCFVREGKTYCKRDYVRLFGTKCAKCSSGFTKTDFVMRARAKIYHIDCFRCVACSRQLIPGDEFALRDDGLFCKADHQVHEKTDGAGQVNAPPLPSHNGLQLAANAEPMGNTRPRDQVRPQVHKNPEQKTTRVRTVLNEKQLHTLRTCYAANPRPDALMKEQLVEMTALSPRVIRVWFQNKRCKDKKKSILMKQMQQQEKDGRRVPGLSGLQGVPMIATSPVRHESPLHVNAVEVHSYQPPWKALSEFALQADLERLDPTTPSFQQLVNQAYCAGEKIRTFEIGWWLLLQMHGYAESELSHGTPLTYLASEDSLQQPPSNLSSAHIPGTPSDMSSPGSD